ncbi:hypothetical protein [Paenibacillus lutrae]|uniref:Uncharacterized protein n=1 Tax=Paenibacillus lutrae TaxID=2078573 RepID=A0A7X3FLV1_9BACL|nr:hypothetical protein [Paenibacillus lutrae]MVP02098.1 hypothetical protein [Paenibacillus lutrae]
MKFLLRPKKEHYVVLAIRGSELDFMRAEVFIEDMLELAEDDSLDFSLEELLSAIYMDFLSKVRSSSELTHFISTLQQIRKELTPRKKIQRLDEIDDNHLTLQEHAIPDVKMRYCKLNFKMLRKAALRFEVFLMDLNRLDPSFYMTVEELLSLLFMNFIAAIQKGNQSQLIRQMLYMLE